MAEFEPDTGLETTETESPAPDDGIASDLFGDDHLVEDLTPDSGQADSPDSTTTQPSTPPTFNILNDPLEKLPEEYRAHQPVIRGMQADYTRGKQEIAEERQQLALERQQYLNAIQQSQATQAQLVQGAQPDPMQQLRANLSEEERQGLDTVENLLGHRLNPVLQQIQEQQEIIQSMRQVLQQNQQQQQQQMQASIRAEFDQARQTFGDETYIRYIQPAAALTSTPNPDTGANFTIQEAIARLSGVAQQQSEQLNQQATQVRQNAQHLAGRRPASQSQSGTGTPTPAEVLADLEAMGFESG